MVDSDTSTELEATLLTDDSKWWEFLDPETYQVKANLPSPTRSTASLIDWSKKRDTARHGAVGFGFFNRCDSCGNPSPPDFTFCPRCGGEPRGPSVVSMWTVVVKELEDDGARQAAAELFAEGGPEITVSEAYRMLGDLPAVFNVSERKERVAALVQKMAEVGIYSKSFRVDDPSIPWITETIESIVRDPPMLLLFLGLLVLTAGLVVFVGWGWLAFGLLAIGALGFRRFRWYQEHYRVQCTPMIDRLAGFDQGAADEARMLLRKIVDKDMKGSLTICLMEYYALQMQFRKHEAVYGDVLLSSHNALRDLLDQILGACRRYADLEYHIRGVEPAAIQMRVSEVHAQLEGKDARARELLEDEIRHLRNEAKLHAEMTELAHRFRERMKAMTGSIEALRVRMTSLNTAEDVRNEDIPFEEILAELDDELEVFERTFVALEQR